MDVKCWVIDNDKTIFLVNKEEALGCCVCKYHIRYLLIISQIPFIATFLPILLIRC